MKILLADDERMVRLGLADMINELYPQQCQYYEAADGRSALGIARKEKPDVAFIDIRMPQVDGLVCLERIHQISPQTICIILSGFGEFKYAQTALKHGALDYLLKPASPAELSNVLTKARQIIHERWTRENEQFHAYVSVFLNQKQEKSETALLPAGKKDIFELYIITAVGRQILESCRQRLKNALSSWSLHDGYFALTTLDDSIFLLTAIPSKLKNSHRYLVKEQLNSQDCLMSIVCTYPTLTAALHRALNLKKFRLIGACAPIQGCIKLQTVTGCPWFYPAVRLSQRLDSLTCAYRRQDEISFQYHIEELRRSQILRDKFSLLDRGTVASYLYQAIGLRTSACGFGELLRDLETHAETMHVRGLNYQAEMVAKIMNYIETNYMKDIAINTIAEMYHITPNYLSRIFREKSGRRFVDYLTEVRIMNAKRLLTTEPGLSVQDIALKVGYYSSRYFSKIFIRETGMRPSQYRKTE